MFTRRSVRWVQGTLGPCVRRGFHNTQQQAHGPAQLLSKSSILVGSAALLGTTALYLGSKHSIINNDIKRVPLNPDPSSDTYENGLFISSQKELEQEHEDRRESRLRSRLKWIYKLKFAITDYIIEPIITIGRFFELAFMFIPIFITIPFSYLGRRQPHCSNEKKGALLWYKLIRWTLENAGASFIKLGQWAASRTDIFPTEFCNELGNLHSNAKSHSFAYSEKVLIESFGLPLSEVFEELDREPIGVGAIAQVYLGTLSERVIGKRGDSPAKNQKVAIKIMHPGVTKKIQRDIKIMKFFAGLIDLIPTMEWLSLPDEVRNFEILMNLQLDLRIEALNLLKFKENFKKNIFIDFPEPYINYSNRFMLIEEYVQGISMSKFLELKNRKNENEIFKRVSDEMMDSFLQMLILNNFIHSDLHPGNIFIRFIKTNELRSEVKSSVKDQINAVNRLKSVMDDNDKFVSTLHELHLEGFQPEICYIDAGLVTELNELNRVNFIALFNALAEFDGYKAGELMIERSKTPETAIDTEIFAIKVERLVDKIKQRTFTLGTVSIGDLLEKMLSMVRGHHVRMEGDFISVIVAILLIEGIGRQLDPDLDLFARFVYFAIINGIPEY
jgi:aarF domain-containing kinase